MKTLLIRYSFFFLFVTSFCGCEKNQSASPSPTLDAYLKSEPRLSMFSKALTIAGLESFKSGPGPFTWFSPTNEAFAAAMITEDSFNRMTPGQVSYLLLYHMANADLNGTNMVALNSSPRSSQLGAGSGSIYIGSVNAENYVNGTKIISRDNKVSNGYVHILNKLNVPPLLRGNLQSILTATGQHSLFIEALTKAALWTNLGTTAVNTIFAPTNAAMTAAGYSSASIATANVATLATAMRYHYISNLRLFTNDLNRSSLPATAAGSSNYITPSDNGTKIKGKNNASPALITKPDNLGTNGVIHIIDTVLKP